MLMLIHAGLGHDFVSVCGIMTTTLPGLLLRDTCRFVCFKQFFFFITEITTKKKNLTRQMKQTWRVKKHVSLEVGQ